MKVDLGSANFAAQYQQAPVPPEGHLIRWDWFKTSETPPPWKQGDIVKKAGLTQDAVARRLKNSQSFVANYEGGERRIDVVEFLNIA